MESIEIGGKTLKAGHEWQQHTLVTDADHTGAMTEAVITLPTPLAVGASVEVMAIYSGHIAQRLRSGWSGIGAPSDAARAFGVGSHHARSSPVCADSVMCSGIRRQRRLSSWAMAQSSFRPWAV